MKPIVSEWLHVARTDLLAAEKLCLDEDITNVVCFHAQQCVEKYLKAILEDKDIVPLKAHDLIRLYAMVEDVIKIDEDMLARLNELYIDSRYPARGVIRWLETFWQDVQDNTDTETVLYQS